MVNLHETIPTKKEIDERTARSASIVAFSGIEVGSPVQERSHVVPSALMSIDGISYDKLSPRHWREIAMYTEPELYDVEERIMPFSEEALGDSF